MMYDYIEMERERERKWESCEPFLFFLWGTQHKLVSSPY